MSRRSLMQVPVLARAPHIKWTGNSIWNSRTFLPSSFNHSHCYKSKTQLAVQGLAAFKLPSCCISTNGNKRINDYHKAFKQKEYVKRTFRAKRIAKQAKESAKVLYVETKERVEEIIHRENIVTIPNMLCIARIVASPVIGYLVVQEDYNTAFVLFGLAGLTDMLDGYIARNWENQKSVFGSFLDPFADKLLVAILFLSLTISHLIPVALTALIILRDIALVASGFYIRYLSLPEPKTLARFLDPTHATARLSPTLISKANTAVQLSLVALTLAAPVFHYIDHPFLHALWYVTASTTVLSAFSYLFRKDTYQILRKRVKKNN